LSTLSQLPNGQLEKTSLPGDLPEFEQIGWYLQLVENHMKEALPFLDPSFTIRQLSATLEIPVHHCSFVLNQGLGKNFREYINKYRVEYFIQEYPLRIANQTLESIANISGFKSSSTFYASFKKETGTSPTAYFS
jgi:AraC-like DNA-binding protein